VKRLTRSALCLAACSMVLAAAAHADVSVENSTAPTFINLVGWNGTQTDPAGAFTVIVRDEDSAGMPNVEVVIELSGCVGVLVCPDAVLTGMTGGGGVISFNIRGHGTPFGPSWAADCATISAGGFVLGNASVSTFDLNGGGTGGLDLSLWLTDFGTGIYQSRSDFNHDGSVGGADLAFYVQAFGTGASYYNCN